ncbi:MAG: GNAT family N-acetyltransferase [Chloroflexi bacterium]|nr:GNAT family N-acetyltransferase [Chloroflexota bacterium]
MKIRHVTHEDVTTLSNWWEERSPQDVRDLVKRALRLKAHERGGGYVALNDQVPCGFAMLTYWVNVAEISDLFVIPGHRGQGIGTDILKTLLEKARKAGYTDIEIGVLASNTRARRLYERVGFVPVRTIQHKFSHGYEDIIYLLSSAQ